MFEFLHPNFCTKNCIFNDGQNKHKMNRLSKPVYRKIGFFIIKYILQSGPKNLWANRKIERALY